MNYYIKSNRVHKPSLASTDPKTNKSEDYNCCMICVRTCSSDELKHDFCNKCLAKQICKLCILEIISQPCPFCTTNNKQWRLEKRRVIMEDIHRKVGQKKAFWCNLNISKKNIHLQYAIKCGIQEFIQTLDSVIQKLSEDIKYLVKIDFEKNLEEKEEEVTREIEEINEMEERYDTMMIELKNEFQIEPSDS